MTIAHTGIRVPAARYAAVVTWYEAALAPLGYKKAMTFVDGQVIGFADATGIADWWVSSAAVPSPGDALAGTGPGGDVASVLPTHISFVAKGQLFTWFHTFTSLPVQPDLGCLMTTKGRCTGVN